MSTLAELAKPLTPTQLRDQMYSGLAALGVTTTDWKPGAVVRTIIAVLAVVLSGFSELISLIARAGFLELATGPWLDLVAYYVYDTRRNEETFGTGTVTLTNVTGAAAFIDVPAGDLVVKATSGDAEGKTYRSTATFSLPATIGATVVVPIQADESGSESTAFAGEITGFVTTYVGCSVANTSSIVGSDREGDASLRARARAKTGVLSPNGPRDAYTYLATSAKRADGTSIGITRVRSVPDGVGGLDVYVADEDGTVTGTVGDETTDLGIIDRDIQEQAAPLAIDARLHAATPLEIPVTYQLWIGDDTGLTTDEIKGYIETALQTYLSRVAIGGDRLPLVSGGYVYVSAIQGAITGARLVVEEDGVETSRTVSEYLVRVEVTIPASAVAVADNEAPVLGGVTGTVTQVPLGSLT